MSVPLFVHEPLIFILYDGIENSVFSGQVLEPLRKYKKAFPEQRIILLSFERKNSKKEKFNFTADGIECYVFRKYPFWGSTSLYLALRSLKKFLAIIPAYTIIARGPLAGWLALHTLNVQHCKKITIQARGLLADELRYTLKTKKQGRLLSWLHHYRVNALNDIERSVYATPLLTIPVIFEVVSVALKEHLVRYYKTESHLITIAEHDIPPAIDKKQIKQWREEIRLKLGISSHTHVYCYNGSIKIWACPQMIINFFVEQQKKKKNSFLLVLTQDRAGFVTLLQKQSIDASHYFVCSVSHNDVYRYLAAADAGIIFRENNIINWVSRPTKVLEYHAVGLQIIHNNTIAYLNSI